MSDAPQFPFNVFAPPEKPDEIGRFAGYRILGTLGEGSMGIVLRGEELALGRPVALKLMKAVTANSRERFELEARAAAAVEHPRIVVIYAVGEWNGTPYIAMPLMKGMPLSTRMVKGQPLSQSEAVRYAREMAEGLAAAHGRGLIHRDIKPANVWLEKGDDGSHVRLLDFGLVRSADEKSLTGSGTILGTPSYVAPEQAAGDRVDSRADLFSLGCVLYQMVTGANAFSGPDIMAILSKIQNHQPPPANEVNPSVPTELSALIDKLLSKQPAGRPNSASELVAKLRAIETNMQGEYSTIAFTDNPPRKGEARRWRVWAVAALVAAIIGGSLAFAWMQYRVPSIAAKDSSSGAVPADLRVKSIDLQLYSQIAPRTYQDSGLLGRAKFVAKLHDRVRIEVLLSAPGYAYLLAFRPDGVMELCLPLDPNEPPTKADMLLYHPTEKGTAYGLDEGSGLWAFAALVSATPLPPYKDWLDRLPSRDFWKPKSALGGAVWCYDDHWSEKRTANGVEPLNRSANAKLDGPEQSLRSLVEGLNASKNDQNLKVSVIGFAVAQTK